MPDQAPDEFEHTLGENVVLAGQYEIVRKLGEGGMGEVHLAKDRLLNDRLVAIKMLPALRAASKRAMKQLRREAAAMADLTHEHIVRFFHFAEHEGLPFLVMQYIEGQTLDDLLDEEETLTTDELLDIAKPIAEALDYAHSKGVVHKDIKPANIFIDKAGKAYLADFGIARVAKDTITHVTGRDLTSGTLHYMSPEQCRGELNLKPASDIYSFATMLYECLCGHVPFPTGPIRELILHQSPPPLEDQSPLAKAVMQALAKSPDDRPTTASELLQQATEKPPVAARAEERPVPPEVASKPEPAPPATPAASEPDRLRPDSGLLRRGEEPHHRKRKGVGVVPAAAVIIAVAVLAAILSQQGSTSKELTLDLGGGVTMELALIPAGEFMMGSRLSAAEVAAKYDGKEGWYKSEHPRHSVRIPESFYEVAAKYDGKEGRYKSEHPRHSVRITKSFYMGRYEVTQEQWQAVMGDNLSRFKGDGRLPVDTVSWDDCQEFCRKLSQLAGREIRLPTEAEWEYACRAGTTTVYSFGDDANRLDEYAWCDENSGNKTHPVGQKKPNPWNLYDMHGNVWEWCEDVWRDSYEEAPTDGSACVAGAVQTRRVLRGGSWYYYAYLCRSANRRGASPGVRYYGLGFRVAAGTP